MSVSTSDHCPNDSFGCVQKPVKFERVEVAPGGPCAYFSSLEDRAGRELLWQLAQDPVNVYSSESIDVAVSARVINLGSKLRLQGTDEFCSVRKILRGQGPLEAMGGETKAVRRHRPVSKSSGARLESGAFRFEEEEREVIETRKRATTEAPRFLEDLDI